MMQGFGIPKEAQDKTVKFVFHGEEAELRHGSVVIAAITSCTNTSNPTVMLGAGLVAKKACELGLKVFVSSNSKFWFDLIIFGTSNVFIKCNASIMF